MREDSDGVTVEVDAGVSVHAVVPPSPLLVPYLWRAKSDHFDVLVTPHKLDVDEAQRRQRPTEGNPGDDEQLVSELSLQCLKHLVSDEVPHVVHDLLHFAPFGGMLVLLLSVSKFTLYM